MHIIALGWIYVVFMMAITEKSVIAGIMTFSLYCALPLGLVWFLFKRKQRTSTDIKTNAQHNNTSRPRHDTDQD